jgi:uncharacterized membrane protein (DUF106 family)
MKKITLILVAAFLTMFIVSCGNPMEKDAKKLAKMYCELMELDEEWEKAYDADDEEKMKEIEAKMDKIDEEGEAFAEECEEKYGEQEKEFEKIFKEEIKTCE